MTVTKKTGTGTGTGLSERIATVVGKRTEGQGRIAGAMEKMNSSGIKAASVAQRLLGHVAVAATSKSQAVDERAHDAANTLAEMEPSNLTEAMLASQMIAVHEAALRFLSLATLENQTFEGADANVLRAVRLMQVFTAQLEAMQRLKGKAVQQKVRVEHVHVHHGAQAIVGTVTAGAIPGKGVGDGRRND